MHDTSIRLFSIVAMVAALLTESAAAGTAGFDDCPAGAPPPGWAATQTGRGQAKWQVVADDTAPSPGQVLKQSGEASFPICIKNEPLIKNGFVEVKFKPISGRVDQAAGLLWRCQDADNYYVARANALEDNVTIYYTVKGKRTEKKRVPAKAAAGQWHTLRVDFNWTHFTVTLDGKNVLEWDDATFPEAGKVGVWTKADSVTLFDDFQFGEK